MMGALTWEIILAIGILIGMVLGVGGMMARMDRDDWNNPWPNRGDE